MNSRWHTFTRNLLIVSGCFCLSSFLSAEPSKLESNSPFLPPGYKKLKPVQPESIPRSNSPIAKDLEFRGVVQLNGTYQISLFRKSENRGYWIAENSSENGISVSNFDVDSMSVTINAGGRIEQLSLMAASENPLPVATSEPSPLPPQARSNRDQMQNTNEPKRRRIPRRRVIMPPKKNP